MTTIADFPVHRGRGKARPVFAHQLAPSDFDDALGATEAREAWEAANAAGEEAERAYLAVRKEFDATHPQRDYADRDLWMHERNLATRELEREVARCERRAEAALRAYHAAQRASGANLDTLATEKAHEADQRVRDALAALGEALRDRSRFVAYASRLYLKELTTQVPPDATALGSVMKERGQ